MRKPSPPQTIVTLDASGKVLGRFATQVAVHLMGKHRPSYRPDAITGDKVVVENAKKIMVTGNKLTQKHYHHFSGYAGGLRSTNLRDKLAKDPTSIITLAVKRMLPNNRQRALLLKRLTVKP